MSTFIHNYSSYIYIYISTINHRNYCTAICPSFISFISIIEPSYFRVISCSTINQVYQHVSMDWFRGEVYRKTPYLIVKSMVSCKFSLKLIH